MAGLDAGFLIHCGSAGLAQLGRIDEARAAIAELKKVDACLALTEAVLMRNYRHRPGIDHILDGLHKAGFE